MTPPRFAEKISLKKRKELQKYQKQRKVGYTSTENCYLQAEEEEEEGRRDWRVLTNKEDTVIWVKCCYSCC